MRISKRWEVIELYIISWTSPRSTQSQFRIKIYRVFTVIVVVSHCCAVMLIHNDNKWIGERFRRSYWIEFSSEESKISLIGCQNQKLWRLYWIAQEIGAGKQLCRCWETFALARQFCMPAMPAGVGLLVQKSLHAEVFPDAAPFVSSEVPAAARCCTVA